MMKTHRKYSSFEIRKSEVYYLALDNKPAIISSEIFIAKEKTVNIVLKRF